jgi:dihydroorotase
MTNNLLLQGGRVIDPASGLDGVRDVLVAGGRIANGSRRAWRRPMPSVIDCSGRLVLPGLIDTHAHVYEHVTGRFGLNADLCGVQSGVTTLVDQGGAELHDAARVSAFRRPRRQPAVVLAFLSAYLVGGLEGHYYSALYRPDCVDIDATVRAADANRDLVKGIKAHAELGGFARWGVEVIKVRRGNRPPRPRCPSTFISASCGRCRIRAARRSTRTASSPRCST